MPMTTPIHLFSLVGYITLSFFYFVERNYLQTAILWIGLLTTFFIFKSMRRQFGLMLIVGLCFAFFKCIHLMSSWLAWPLDFYLTTLFGYFLLRVFKHTKPVKLNWSFRFSKNELLSICLINIPTLIVLYWYYRTHPEVAALWPIPKLPLWSTPLVVAALALTNGLREEIFYRGFIQPLSVQNSPVWFSIALQAVLFGFLHFANAFPQGWLGVILTAIWGVAIAIQYRVFRSISLAWMTHSIADAVMFSIILCMRN